MELQPIRDAAITIAREAGDVLMGYFDQPHQQQTKNTPIDIVTEGDKASEAVIVAALTQQFPDHHIIGEEGGGMGAPAEDAEYFWYVDPLDGTSNYASNIPCFSVSIALADRNLNPLVGVIFDPFADQMFSAARGFGAALNGKRLRVSTTSTLQSAMLGTGVPYDSHTNPDNNLREWAAFVVRTRGLRRFGSAALDLCFVAAGRFDGFWEQRVNAWDVMAGILMVREAGGYVTDYTGAESELMYRGRQVVASNKLLHEDILAVLQEARKGL
jgi:myo-inositol-1(or 4)-monophosphatase